MQTLLLLHGAIGSVQQMQPLVKELGERYKIHTLNFSGHGGREFADETFSIKLFADDVIAFLKDHNIDKVSIFGYSMGGYVGMYMAKHYPDKLDKVITLATKYHWDKTTAEKEAKMLDPEKMQAKIPAFAAILQERHTPEDWKKVVAATAEMMLALGNDNTIQQTDYSSILHPCLIMLGDRDKMVSLGETVTTYKALPNGSLCILPATPHPIEQIDTVLLASMIKQFLQ